MKSFPQVIKVLSANFSSNPWTEENRDLCNDIYNVVI